MRKVSVGNPQVSDTYRTFLASAYYSGGLTLDVLSNVSFAANDLAVIGEVGEELAELKKVDSISGKNTITLSSVLNFEHEKDKPVYKVNWDYVSIEGDSGTGWSVLTLSPLQWDRPTTIYNHQDGTDSWSYRFRYYNSVTGIYSEYSPTVVGSGFTRYQVGYMIRQVRKITNDLTGRVVGDKQIIGFFNAAQDIIRGVKDDWEFLKVTDTSVTTTANTKKYALPSGISDTGNVLSIRYEYNDGTNDIIYALKFLPEAEFDVLDEDQNRSTDDYAQHYTFAEADSSSASGYIRIDPPSKTTGYGTFHIRYSKEMTDLDTVADATLIPIPSLLQDFAIAKVFKIMGNEAAASVYENLFYGREIVGRRVISVDSGINTLIKMDTAKKRPGKFPMSLWRFRGNKLGRRFYNNRAVSRDYIKENYF